MIRLNLEIHDTGRHDSVQLLALAALFTTIAQGNKAEQTRAALEDKTKGAGMAGAGAQLDAADNPATGMPSPAEAFGTTMGNGAAGSVSASSPSLASTGAASTSASQESENGGPSAPAASLPDPAVAFGSGGNAPAVPSVTPSGTPPAPNSGAQTAGAATPASAAGVELDAEGLPWDASIHASTRAKLANGNWKVKRGTGEAYLNERKAVLRAAVAAGGNAGAPATPAPNASPVPAPGAGAPVPPPPPAPTSAPGNVQTPTGTPSPGTTPGTAGSSTVTLAQVMPRVTAAISAGTLTVDSAAAIVRELSDGKIDNVAMLAVAPALLPAFVARLDALGIPA